MTDGKLFVQNIQPLRKLYVLFPITHFTLPTELDALFMQAASAIRTFRTGFGKTGLKVMDRLWMREDMQEYSTQERRKAWVEHQLEGLRFLYARPDATVRF